MSDDGLDPVARLGGTPSFDAATDARVRAKVLGLLQDDGVAPPGGFAGPDDDVVVDLGAPTPSTARRRAGSRWGLRAAMAAAVAAVLVVVVVGLISSQDDPLPSIADFADAAANGPHTTISDGEQLVIVRERQVADGYQERSVLRVGVDGSGTERYQNLTDQTDSTNDYGPGQLVVGGVPYTMLVDLPADPDELVAALLGFVGDEASVPRALIELTSTTATDPAVRAAAVQALIERAAEVEEVDGVAAIVVVDANGNRLVATVDMDRGVVTTLDATGAGIDERTQFLGTSSEPA